MTSASRWRRRSRAPYPGIDHVMCFYGVGDHGGGPTRRQIAWIRAHRDSFDGARLVFSHPRAFFDAVKPRAATLPVVSGELQMHAIGCYSVVRDIKTGMRRAEHALLAAEAATAAFPRHAPPDAAARLDGAWRLALFNQFHDVYGGSSLDEACDDARDQLGAARSTAESVLYDTLFRKAVDLPGVPHQRVVAFNPSDAAVRRLHPLGAVGRVAGVRRMDRRRGRARPVPHQVLPASAVIRDAFSLLWPARIAPRSIAVFTLRHGQPPAPRSAAPAACSRRDGRRPRRRRLERGPGDGPRPPALRRRASRIGARRSAGGPERHLVARHRPVRRAGGGELRRARLRGRGIGARPLGAAPGGGLRREHAGDVGARVRGRPAPRAGAGRSTGASAGAWRSSCSRSPLRSRSGRTASRRWGSSGRRTAASTR